MILGRVFLSVQTTALAIESIAGLEEAVETTITVGDDTGNPSERRPADKLLLVERVGLGIMYNQNKNQRKARERRANATRQQMRKPWSTTGEILLHCFCCGLFYPNWEPLHWACQKTTLSDQRAPIGPATSERQASRDEPEKTMVVTEQNSFKSPTRKKATLGQPKAMLSEPQAH